ncbi:MAG TPA: c-type cytochrome [Burkholderiales bacterium]|nr:c-type cytochrome [Burkholderiales bacterium]
MKTFATPILAGGLALAAAAPAAEPTAPEALARASGCFTCHALDRKLIGPSYRDIAARYRGSRTAQAELFEKVKSGGRGVWGDVPMPPQAHLKDEDIKTLVLWILSAP